MLQSRHFHLACAILVLLGATALYVFAGVARPPGQLDLLGIASHAGIALMAGIGLSMVLSSRPAGRASILLAAGLAALMLGAWAACLAEFFVTGTDQPWAQALEGGATLAGIIGLSLGLSDWRREQMLSTEPLQQREGLLRDHRSFDGLTQVGDADYLREQLRIEHRQGKRCSLLMLDIDGFSLINREHGQREGDRLLQAVTQMLRLNLRGSDLLCRYAGDRFGVLLPATELDAARVIGEQLRRAVATLRHHPQRGGQPIVVTMRTVERHLDCEPRQLLKEVNRALERRMPRSDADAVHAASVA